MKTPSIENALFEPDPNPRSRSSMVANLHGPDRRMLGALLAGIMLAACEMPGDGSGEPPLSDRLQALSGDLTVGSVGDDVRTVHEYLSTYGYFPSADLVRAYPAWRPLVGGAPADQTVFDDRTAEALRKLQENGGLCPSGKLDAATRELMKQPRCGVPDGISRVDDTDKFSLYHGGIGRGARTWKFDPSGGTANLPPSAVPNVLASAFATWTAVTSGLTFTRVTSGNANVLIRFGTPNGGSLGSTDRQTITLGKNIVWSTNGTGNDLKTVAEHEIGHALGFCHSAFPSTVMKPFYTGPAPLALDDTVVASALYDSYTQMSGAAQDIGIGGNGDVWIIGTNVVAGTERGIWKFTGTKSAPAWATTVDLAGAVRISVDPNGFPWVVQSNGSIWRRNSNSPFSGFFQQVGGGANDIGVGANGEVWITGMNPVNGGFQVYKYNGNPNAPRSDISEWTATDGGAVKVSVTADGIPWVVTSSGKVFYRNTNQASFGTWFMMSGTINDIAVGPLNPAIPNSGFSQIPVIWSIATNGAGNANLSAFALQPGGSDCLGSNIALAEGWLSGTAVGSGGGGPNSAVAVAPDGQPWVVDHVNRIFTSLR
jgi:peptidoglycan hydrolase-like protein with peptidoglycan-binding domain